MTWALTRCSPMNASSSCSASWRTSWASCCLCRFGDFGRGGPGFGVPAISTGGDRFGCGDHWSVARIVERGLRGGSQGALDGGGAELGAGGGFVVQGAVAQSAVDGCVGGDRFGDAGGGEGFEDGEGGVELAQSCVGNAGKQGGGVVDDRCRLVGWAGGPFQDVGPAVGDEVQGGADEFVDGFVGWFAGDLDVVEGLFGVVVVAGGGERDDVGQCEADGAGRVEGDVAAWGGHHGPQIVVGQTDAAGFAVQGGAGVVGVAQRGDRGVAGGGQPHPGVAHAGVDFGGAAERGAGLVEVRRCAG